MLFTDYWRHFIFGIIATGGAFGLGLTVGWTSPSQGRLQDATASPLGRPLESHEMPWVASVHNVLAALSPFLSGWLLPWIGPKWTLACAVLAQALGWSVKVLAGDVLVLVLARALLGAGSGLSLSSVVFYIGEITNERSRSAVSSLVRPAIVLGILFGYCVGPFLPYRTFLYVCLAITCTSLLLVCFLPDSPTYLLMKGNHEGASNNLIRLYGGAESNIQEELNKIQTRHLTGYSVFLSFLVAIFEEAGSTVEPAIAAIIVGAVQVVACFAMTLVIGKVRRKALLIASLLIIIASLVVLGTYMKLSADGADLTTVGFIPLICLICFMWSFNFGLSALTWVFLVELSTPDVRPTCAVLANSTAFLVAFIAVFSFSALTEAIGAHGAFWTCAGFTFLLLLIAIFVIPETRGKTIEEVQEELRK